MPYDPVEQTAGRVTLGAFVLSPSLVAMIDNFEPLPLTGNLPLPEALKGRAVPDGSGLYIGTDPAAPKVGDSRINFMMAPPTDVSVIAGQAGQTFTPYQTRAGGTIELLDTGVYTAGAMIQEAQQSNRILTWGLRLGGFLLMFIGFTLLFRPLSVAADVLPILGSIVGAGTGLVAFLLAAVLSLVTIAVAWFVYRPVLGIILIAVATGLAAVIVVKVTGPAFDDPSC
jgi:hypothetical protein